MWSVENPWDVVTGENILVFIMFELTLEAIGHTECEKSTQNRSKSLEITRSLLFLVYLSLKTTHDELLVGEALGQFLLVVLVTPIHTKCDRKRCSVCTLRSSFIAFPAPLPVRCTPLDHRFVWAPQRRSIRSKHKTLPSLFCSLSILVTQFIYFCSFGIPQAKSALTRRCIYPLIIRLTS